MLYSEFSIFALPLGLSHMSPGPYCVTVQFVWGLAYLVPKAPPVLQGELRKYGCSLALGCQGFGSSREAWPYTQDPAHAPLWHRVLDLLFGV